MKNHFFEFWALSLKCQKTENSDKFVKVVWSESNDFKTNVENR